MNIGGFSGAMPDFSAMRDRLNARMSERFDKNDIDKSGGISFDELSKAREAHEKPPISEISPISRREAPPKDVDNGRSLEDVFAHLDEDQDGEISKKEMMDAKPKRPPPPFGRFSNNMMLSLLSAQEEAGNKLTEMFLKKDKEKRA